MGWRNWKWKDSVASNIARLFGGGAIMPLELPEWKSHIRHVSTPATCPFTVVSQGNPGPWWCPKWCGSCVSGPTHHHPLGDLKRFVENLYWPNWEKKKSAHTYFIIYVLHALFEGTLYVYCVCVYVCVKICLLHIYILTLICSLHLDIWVCVCVCAHACVFSGFLKCFPDESCVECDHLYIFFGTLSVQILCPCLLSGYMLLFCSFSFFLLLICFSSFCIFDLSSLLEIWFPNIFSHSVRCLFILVVSFTVHKFLSLVS